MARGKSMRTAISSLALLGPMSGAPTLPEIELSPDASPGFGIRNIGAAASTPFRGWSYWHRERLIRLETVPARARVELMFIRDGLQHRYERAEPPVRVRLPSRIETTSRDALKVRARASGHETRELTLPVNELPRRLVVTLEPLPNALVFVALSHVARRSRLTFRTTEEVSFRLVKSGGGFALSLARTVDKLATRPRLAGGLVSGVEWVPVGRELLLQIATVPAPIEVRSRRRFDPVRGEHVLIVELAPEGHRAPLPEEVRRELRALDFDPADPCARRFEQMLLRRLDLDRIARARRPSDEIATTYRREAMRALAAASGGTVRLPGELALRVERPVELELALQSALTVEGYLALLGAWARSQAAPATALRSIAVPGSDPDEFDRIHLAAESDWLACRGRVQGPLGGS